MTLKGMIETIEDEVDYVDVKPYSHNIIGLTLRGIAEKYGNAVADAMIEEYRLDELGWKKKGE